MAETKFDGFPKVLKKAGSPDRYANTPTDEVNLVSRGYKVAVAEAAEVNEKSAPASTPKKN